MILAFALLLQDVDALVADLSHDDPEVRDRAVEQLIAAGEKALPALKRAADSRDPDVASRARAALERIDLNQKVARFRHQISDKLLDQLPEIVRPLASGGEAELLQLVTDLRGIGEGPAYVGTPHEFEGKELVPVFKIIWDHVEAARKAGSPMARLEPVFLTALYWRSEQPHSASGGSGIMIRAVPPDRLVAVYLDVELSAENVLEELLERDPPFESRDQVRQMLEATRAGWNRVGALLAGQMGELTAIPRLRELLEAPDTRVAAAAAEALGRLGDVESAVRIAGVLEGGRYESIRGGGDALARLEAYDQVEAIIAAAESADGYNKGYLIERLVEMRAEAVAPRLVEWSSVTDNSTLHRAVLEGLARFRPEGSDEAFDEMLTRTEPWSRYQLAEALADMGDTARLARMMEGNTEWYRARILELAARAGVPGVDEQILKELDTPDAPLIRLAGERKLVAAASKLVGLAGDEAILPDVIAALALIPTKDFETRAADWLASTSNEVRSAVLEAAPALTVEQIVAHLEVKETRPAAMRALVRLHPEEAKRRLPADDPEAAFALSDVERVKALLKHADAEMRRRAAEWLAGEGDASGADLLVAEAESGSDDERIAADHLARLHHPSARRLMFRRMLKEDAPPFLINAPAQSAYWDQLGSMKLPDGAPERATLEELAAWLSKNGVPTRIDESVRPAFRGDAVSVPAENVRDLLERVHGLSRGSRVRLEEGGVVIETTLAARRFWMAWGEKQNP